MGMMTPQFKFFFGHHKEILKEVFLRKPHIVNCGQLFDVLNRFYARTTPTPLKNGQVNMARLMGNSGLKETVAIYTKNRQKKSSLHCFCRIYEGHVPVLVTSDPNMVEQVFIKQFSNFTARKVNFQLFPFFEI